MNLKLACADFTFPLLAHDHVLDLIAMLGFEGVDVGLFEGRSYLWPSRVFPKRWAVSPQLGQFIASRLFSAANRGGMLFRPAFWRFARVTIARTRPQTRRPRLEARRPLPPNGAGLRVACPQPPGACPTCAGARPIFAGTRIRGSVRLPPPYGVARRVLR